MAAWLGRRPATTAADRPQQRLGRRPAATASGSARVSRPRRNTRPKVSPFSRRPSVGGVARSETGRNSGGPATTAARSETGHNGLRFGAGLQTSPKHPTEGLPILQETFGWRRGSVGDRPQQRLGRRPATTASGSARVSRPRRNTRPKVSPFRRRPSVGGVARSETGHNSGGPATTAADRPQQRRPAATAETGYNGRIFAKRSI